MFTDTKKGCLVPDLVEFYANCVVTNGVVTSTVNGHEVRFDARELDKLLRVLSKGLMCMYMRTRAYLVMSDC